MKFENKTENRIFSFEPINKRPKSIQNLSMISVRIDVTGAFWWQGKENCKGSFTRCVLFVCDCNLFTLDFMKLFTWCNGCGYDLLCIHIGIAHRNNTEWVWNPFMCDIAHRNASHKEHVIPCEHSPKPTYNPFHFTKSHVNKSQSQTKKTAPC